MPCCACMWLAHECFVPWLAHGFLRCFKGLWSQVIYVINVFQQILISLSLTLYLWLSYIFIHLYIYCICNHSLQVKQISSPDNHNECLRYVRHEQANMHYSHLVLRSCALFRSYGTHNLYLLRGWRIKPAVCYYGSVFVIYSLYIPLSLRYILSFATCVLINYT